MNQAPVSCRWVAASLTALSGAALSGGIFTTALLPATGAILAVAGLPASVLAQDGDEGEKLKPFADVSKGFEKVSSTTDGASFYTLYTRKRDGAMLAELPRGWEGQKHFIALTLATGDTYAGLQSGDMYVYWRKQDNKLVMIEPNVGTRSTGDQESKSSIKNLFTDRVVLDVPIVSTGPNGQPVIDMRDLLVGKIQTFYGGQASGANGRLATLKRAKSFPQNVEIEYELPVAGGQLRSYHWSISVIPDSTGYEPRKADSRVGFFTTTYRDLGKMTDDQKWVRYVNRWHLEKRDPKLKKSPPKQPIVFYIDSAVPVRYRTYIRDGILIWNKAFEKIGIVDAVQVYQQDESTGEHMDKDPEDVRYNFIRWLANDQGTAIGPSRVHPLTGQILDADVVLTDGWIRHFWVQFNEIMPELAMEGMSPETLAWLDTRPQWDPRIRLADPAARDGILAARARRGILAYGGHPIAAAGGTPESRTSAAQHATDRLMGTGEFDGLLNRTSQVNGLCLAARGKAFDMATMQLSLDMMDAETLAAMAGEEFAPAENNDDPPAAEGDKKDEKKDEKKKEKKKDENNLLDGIPDWFVGPLLADLVTHEVGHTIGLRHNFKASAQYSLAEINSEAIKGKKAFAASVMDYIPVNFSVKDGKPTGDWGLINIGDYDMWAIEYGYTFGDTAEVLKKAGTPGLEYGTDEDTGGPDPLARRYDFAKDPLDYAKSQMELARYHRSRILDKFVKDGDSWAKARRGYTITLGMQTRSLSMMANWVGGTFVNRDKKGDPNARPPLVPVPAQQQRDALNWVIANSFFDESFGLTPDLVQKMTTDKWLDEGGAGEARQESTFPVHERVAGIQSSVMTMLLNPTTLRRVYDNEFAIAQDQDAVTLPEVIDTVTNAVWDEVVKAPSGSFTARKPMISSLRRNLQREYVDRMIDLTLPGSFSGEAGKPVSNLATAKLRELKDTIGKLVDNKGRGLDPYTFAHLSEAKMRIEKALDANFVYNASSMGGGGFGGFFFGQPIPENTIVPSIQPEPSVPSGPSSPDEPEAATKPTK